MFNLDENIRMVTDVMLIVKKYGKAVLYQQQYDSNLGLLLDNIWTNESLII